MIQRINATLPGLTPVRLVNALHGVDYCIRRFGWTPIRALHWLYRINCPPGPTARKRARFKRKYAALTDALSV